MGAEPMTDPDLARQLIDRAPTPAFIKDLDGRYLMANGEFYRLFGLSPAEVLGRHDHELPYLVLHEQDEGPGIDPAILPRIFEPFFSTKEPGKGTGLGLSMVYGIVRQWGGDITVRNEDGACFEVWIPEELAMAEPTPVASPPPPPC